MLVDNSFRLMTLLKIAENAGILSSFVEKNLGGDSSVPSDFKEKFAQSKPGPQRDQLVYDELVKRNKKPDLVPITVNGPASTKITYFVMPDYLNIDGLRVTVAGQMAQKIADHFGMHLPTPKMTQQIYDNADEKLSLTPLSAGGEIGGRHYTGEEVVKHKISDSDSALAYSQMAEDKIKNLQGKPNLISGYMKQITQPDRPGKLSLYGLYDKSGNPIQSSSYTPHDTSVHSEYASGLQLTGDKVIVTAPDGRKVETTMENILNNPNFAISLSNSVGLKRY